MFRHVHVYMYVLVYLNMTLAYKYYAELRLLCSLAVEPRNLFDSSTGTQQIAQKHVCACMDVCVHRCVNECFSV